MINIALPKGRLGEKVYNKLKAIGYGCPAIEENSRKLIFENEENGVRYFWAKPSDVAIYVERGAADIGVAGKDILLEYEPDVYDTRISFDYNIVKGGFHIFNGTCYSPAVHMLIFRSIIFGHHIFIGPHIGHLL